MAYIANRGSIDGRAVIDAAQALRIREYDLFRAAFRRWWGREADTKALERVFVAYMFHQVVPPWVRHFCRQTWRCSTATASTPRRLASPASGGPKGRRPWVVCTWR